MTRKDIYNKALCETLLACRWTPYVPVYRLSKGRLDHDRAYETSALLRLRGYGLGRMIADIYKGGT